MFKYKHIYIASCGKESGIYHYVTEGENIIFKEMTQLDRVMYMCIEGEKLYAILREPFEDNKNSAIVTLDINDDGSLSNLSKPISTLGEVCAHLDVCDGKVFAANYISGSVVKLPDTLSEHKGMGVNLPRQDKAHCHFTGITPDKKYVLVCDLGIDKIVTYDMNLNYVGEASVPAGFGARHLAFSPDGKLCYCVNELVSSVSVFRYNDGSLEYLETYATLPNDFKEKNTAAAIRIEGGYLYVSNRGHNSVAVMKIEGERLSNPKYFDCGGDGPRDININGDYLFSTNQQTNDVTVLKIKDGELTLTDTVFTMTDPLNVIFN